MARDPKNKRHSLFTIFVWVVALLVTVAIGMVFRECF